MEVDGPSVAASGLDGGLSFAAPPGRVAATFIKVMLEEVCKAQEHAITFAEFFQVLQKIAAVSDRAAAFMIQDGVVGMLIDFMCDGKTPHPELVDGPGGWEAFALADKGAAGGAAAGGGISGRQLQPRPIFRGRPAYYATPALLVVQ